MKKYFFILSALAILATAACDTSSKAATSQPTATVSQPAATSTPVVAVADSTISSPMKKGYGKKTMMQHAEMAPMEKAQMLRKADEAPNKN